MKTSLKIKNMELMNMTNLIHKHNKKWNESENKLKKVNKKNLKDNKKKTRQGNRNNQTKERNMEWKIVVIWAVVIVILTKKKMIQPTKYFITKLTLKMFKKFNKRMLLMISYKNNNRTIWIECSIHSQK